MDKQAISELIDSLELRWEEDLASHRKLGGSVLARYKSDLPYMEFQIHNYPYDLAWNVCVNRGLIVRMETKEDAMRKALQLYHKALKRHFGIND